MDELATGGVAVRVLFTVARVLLIAIAIWWALVYLLQDRLIFPRFLIPSEGRIPADARTVVWRRPLDGDGHVDAWFVPAAIASPARPRPVVVYFHGNAETIDQQRWLTDGYHWMGCSVLLPEYRGYGGSAGKPSQAAIREDAVWFYEQLVRRPDVDPTRIVFHGRSVGGAVAADLTTRFSPRALILQSTFPSAAAVARRFGIPRFLLKNPFDTDRALAQARFPILIFHGRHDTVIPVRFGRILRDTLPNAWYIEYNCDHNDFPGLGNETDYWGRIESFLRDSGVLEPVSQR